MIQEAAKDLKLSENLVSRSKMFCFSLFVLCLLWCIAQWKASFQHLCFFSQNSFVTLNSMGL